MKLPAVVLLSVVFGGVAGVGLAYYSVGSAPVDLLPGAPSPAGLARVPAPRAAVDEPVHDFGTLLQGNTSSHKFVVRNEGDAPLTLAVGKTSCKCTLGNVSNRPIPPGESATVLLEWIAKTLPGGFRQQATIITNDPNEPTLFLVVEGEVVAARGLSPNLLDFGVVDVDRPGVASAYVMAFESEQIEVTAAMADTTSEPERFSVSVAPIEPSATPRDDALAAAKITLEASPGMPVGSIREWIAVTTNLNGGERFLMPVVGQVRGPVVVKGSLWNQEEGVLNLGAVDSIAGKETRLILSCRGGHADKVEYRVAEVDPPELSVTVGERRVLRDGVSHTPLTVAAPPGTRPMVRMERSAKGQASGDGDAVVRLQCNHPKSPEIKLLVRFVVEG